MKVRQGAGFNVKCFVYVPDKGASPASSQLDIGILSTVVESAGGHAEFPAKRTLSLLYASHENFYQSNWNQGLIDHSADL